MTELTNVSGTNFFNGKRNVSVTKSEENNARQRWRTPRSLVSAIELKLNVTFVLDLCADTDNICEDFITAEEDLFKVDIESKIKSLSPLAKEGTLPALWMNPPYGNVPKFMARAKQISDDYNIVVVCLVKADPAVKWWQNFVWTDGTHVLYPKKRVPFIPAIQGIRSSSPAFCSAAVVFGHKFGSNSSNGVYTSEPLDF